jgi:superfamily I DNA/RNA helicase
MIDGDILVQPAEVSDLEDWIEAEHLEALFGAVFAAENGNPRGMLAWLRARLLASKAKAAEFPMAVAARGGGRLRGAPKCFVGTVHSFKGSEADHVFLFPDLSPAGMREWTAGGVARDSVIRTFYVGLTRARSSVYICQPVSFGMAVDLEGRT